MLFILKIVINAINPFIDSSPLPTPSPYPLPVYALLRTYLYHNYTFVSSIIPEAEDNTFYSLISLTTSFGASIPILISFLLIFSIVILIMSSIIKLSPNLLVS
jgi:hypothetical protein